MTNISDITSQQQEKTTRRPSSAFIYVGSFIGIILCVAFVTGIYSVLANTLGFPGKAQTAQAAVVERHASLNLSIVLNQPGMQKDWPGYTPNSLSVPANSIVTVTVRNYDLGDTPLQANSPFSSVKGTTDGKAYVNGIAYNYLAPEKVAHTFSIPQLNINIPIPGDGPQGAKYVTVTFSIHIGKAGVYTFRCFDPCGTGQSGWMGPMITKGYMMGTITAQ